MRIENADERDAGWEDTAARYRVYFFTGGEHPGRSWDVVAKDVLDAQVLEVVHWAEREISDKGLFAVALVTRRADEQGLVWLVGMDANDEPSNGVEESIRAAMHARRGEPTVRLPSA